MKPTLRFLALSLLAATGCSKKTEFIAVKPGPDAVVFTNDMTMANDIQIVMRRDSSGIVTADSFELYNEKSLLGGYKTKARPLVSRTIDPAVYERVVRILENRTLDELARRYPPPGVDGWTWRIRWISPHGKKIFAFQCPEWMEDISGRKLIGLDGLLDMGRVISRAAGVADLDAFQRLEREASQPSMPTDASDLAPP